MILNYYQAIELMSCLPILLSPIDTKANPVMDTLNQQETEHTFEMMPSFSNQLEVNGQLFY